MTQTTAIRTSAKNLLMIGMLMALFAISLPGAARAGNTAAPADPCGAGSTVNQNLQNVFGQVGYTKTNAAIQVLGMYGGIDVKTQYCWQRIQDLFAMIGNLQASSLNPFTAIVGAIVNQIASQIVAFINSACSAALNTIESFKNFALSQLNNMCIPLPQINLGLGTIAGYSFSNAKPCGPGAVPLFTFGFAAAPPNNNYSYRKW